MLYKKISRSRFEELFLSFTKKKVLVLGDIGIDRYTVGESFRISQEAPVPIVSVESSTDKLGLAANVAENLKALGAMPLLASLCGKDQHGKNLNELLLKKHISSDYVFMRSPYQTIVKERVIARGQQIVRVDHEVIQSLSSEEEAFFWKKLEPVIEKIDALIIEDYGKNLISKSLAKKVIQKARQLKKFVAVDPPSTSEEKHMDYYQMASLVTPNIFEAEKLLSFSIKDKASLEKAGYSLLEKLKADYIVITEGKNGMTLFSSTQSPLHIPTFVQEVFDVSGAGDTAISTLTLAFISKASPEESMTLANLASGLEVRKSGTATVHKDELKEFLEHINAFY